MSVNLDMTERERNQVFMQSELVREETYTKHIGDLDKQYAQLPSSVEENSNKIAILTDDLGQTNAQLSSAEKHFNNTIIVEDFGAIGDGVSDDSDAFIDAINYANTHNVAVIKLTKKYRITKNLPNITKGVYVEGVAQGSHEDNHGSIIIDERQSDSYLIKYDNDGVNIVGGGLKRLRIKSVNDSIRHCLFTKNTGWEFTVEDVFIYNYNGTAIFNNSNDATFTRVTIIDCGSRTDGNIYYALENGTNSSEYKKKTNAQHFTHCHFEHCRFMLRINNAFMINFVDCKFEQSTSAISVNSSESPIHIGSSAQINFSCCQFMPIGVHEYKIGNELYFINATQRNPLFDVIDNEGLKFTGCSLITGIGSGGTPIRYEKYKASLFLKSDVITLISGCSFTFLSGIKPSFICSESLIFTDNLVYLKGFNYIESELQNYNKLLACLQCGENSVIDNNIFFLMNNGVKEELWCIKPTSKSVYIGNNVYRSFAQSDIFENRNFTTNMGTIVTSGNLEVKNVDNYSTGVVFNHTSKSLEAIDETYSLGRYGKFWNAGNFKQVTLNPFNALPSSPVEGMIAYDVVNKRFCGYNGTTWKVFDNV